METSMFFGNACQNGLLSALVHPALPTLQPSLGMKQFLPFPLDAASAVSLFPSFSAMDPVQKAVMHHTFGAPPSAKRKHASCSVCQLRFNSQLPYDTLTRHNRPDILICSEGKRFRPNTFLPAMGKVIQDVQNSKQGQLKVFTYGPVQQALEKSVAKSQALAHYKGTKHAKKLKALDAPKCKLKSLMVTKETTNLENSKNINTLPITNCTDIKDNSPAVAPLPLSRVLKLAPPRAPTLIPLSTVLTPVPLPTTRTETTSATARDERPSPEPISSSELDTEPEAEPELEANTETEEEKAKRLLYCSLCKVAVNSASQLDAHNSGTKHKTMLEARSGVGSIKSFPRPGVKSKLIMPTKASTGLQNKTFHCETCDVHVNSETQLKQHISSRRHKDRAAGKPAKPKYSPYVKPPKGSTKQPLKLTVGKDVCQTMTAAQILPSHLAAVAAAMGSAFSLRSTHAACHTPTPTLFQTQTLSAALLRPAPGPVRTSHPQVLFAPY